MLLCMGEASFITGQTIHVDGGVSIVDSVFPLEIQLGYEKRGPNKAVERTAGSQRSPRPLTVGVIRTDSARGIGDRGRSAGPRGKS